MEREHRLFLSDMILFAGTRVALGAGIGLLIATRLNRDQCKGAGCALLAVGVATTVPLGMKIVSGRKATVREIDTRQAAS